MAIGPPTSLASGRLGWRSGLLTGVAGRIIAVLTVSCLAAGIGLAPAQAAPATQAPPADNSAAPDNDRVAALEARLQALEDSAKQHDQDGIPSLSGRGGLRVTSSDVVRDVVGLGGPVDIAGTVLGTALGLGGDVIVRPGGAVQGDAVSLGGDVVVEPGGRLVGHALTITPQKSAQAVLAVPGADGWAGLVHTLGRRLAALLSFMAAGTLALAVWPQQVDEISARMSDRPFWYGVAGAALTIALGTGAVVLAMTVVGLPLALLFLVVLGLSWLMGLVAVCRTASRRLGLTRRHGDTLAWLGGAALFSVMVMVPVFGTLVALLLGFPAVGAAVVSGLSREQPVRSW